MVKAIFVGGQEEGTTRQLEGNPIYVHFIEHPTNHQTYLQLDRKQHNYNFVELTYRLVSVTPEDVNVFELVTEEPSEK